MKVVITGVSGFIGSSIYKKLIELNINVVGVSRKKIDGYFFSEDYLSLPEGDVLIHLGESSDRGWVNSQDESFFENSKTLLNYIDSRTFDKVIYASSSAIYSDKKDCLKRECDLLNIHDTYSRIKLLAENTLNHSNNIVLRLSNVYGEGMSKNNVISDIISQLNKKESIKLNSLNPIRDFIYIDDVVRGFIAAINSQDGGLYNLGSGVGTSIKSLAKKILEIDNQKGREVISTRTSNFVSSNIRLDITHICNIMAWSPEVSLDIGLKKLLLKRNNYE